MKNMASLNLSAYDKADYYSDGDIEEQWLHCLQQQQSEQEILAAYPQDFATFYHFHASRTHLLDWYPFQAKASLLEIGAGCGALTGLLAQRVGTVKAVELSKRRAEIAYHRHAQYKNLEILVGNFNKMHFPTPFDYITLIGVLEYAGKFTQEAAPFLHFLKKIASLLQPKGHLLLAIENKFGLKYFAGAKEDHTGRYFDNLEDYPHQKEVQTFGKTEIIELLQEAGFESINFYYPMPDYKFPKTVYSDAYLPSVEDDFQAHSPNLDQSALLLFDENKAFANICKNKKFDFFANSFLIDAQLCK